MSGAAALGVGLALLATAGGVGLLRLAWRKPQAVSKTAAGWALLIAAIPAWALGAAWDKAVGLGLLAPSLVALAIVAAGLERRTARSPRLRQAVTELPAHSGEALWRALVRTLCGGPLAGGAALLVSAAWALRGEGSQADRLVAALMAAPALWALGLVWATTDPKLARVGGGLGALGLAGGLAAIL